MWVLWVACADPANLGGHDRDPQDSDGPDGGGGGRPPGADRTTWDDVSPVLTARCVSCHQPEGIGPMDLTTWAEAAPWSEAIAHATAERTMPPWLVVSDGSCGEFADPNVLTDDEIALFAAWADDGAPAGAGRELVPTEPPRLLDWDREFVTPVDTPEPEGTALAPSDEYRCYRFPNDAAADWFLTASDVDVSDPDISHHVLVFIVDPEAKGYGRRTNEAEMSDLEDDDDRPGWDCLGTVGGLARERGMPVGWAPGQGIVELPPGLGARVRPQDDVVVQLHYNMPLPEHRGRSASARVRIRSEREVEREAFFGKPDPLLISAFTGHPDTIEPGLAEATYRWSMTIPELARELYQEEVPAGFDLWFVSPHMHQRGLTQTLVYRPDPADPSQDTCVAHVPRWDPGWQRLYPLATPLHLDATGPATVEVTCTYDTRDATEPILGGWGTGNEMCLMGMIATASP